MKARAHSELGRAGRGAGAGAGAALALVAAACAPPAELPVADVVFIGARAVHTLAPEPQPDATALAVADGRIVAVGSELAVLELAGAETPAVHLDGGVVVPGLIDAHAHPFGLGELLATLDVGGAASAAEVAALVAAAAAELEPGRWVVGRGWDQTRWPGRAFPDRALLDEAAPGRPAVLARVDGHAVWASSAALAAAGIDAGTPEPAGGRILRRPDGSPSGVLVDRAAELVEAVVPEPTDAELRRRIVVALERCAAAGLTGVHDAGVGPRQVAVYADLAARGALPIRVYGMASVDADVAVESLPDPVADAGGRWSLRAAKLYADGALGSRGAALLADYADEPGRRGLLVLPPEVLERKVAALMDRGYQVGVHAIGDRANRIVLDVYARLLQGRNAAALRPRVEHAQVLAPADVPRFAALGVIASVQPTHATSDMRWAEDRVGARIEGAYAWRTLLESGARLACGSDFPVESHRPLLGLYAAVTRQDLAGEPPGGWTAEQRMSRIEALRCFTEWNAWAGFAEDDLGTLVPGKLADFVVLDDDPLTVPAAALPGLTVLRTVVGGRVVHHAGAAP